MKRSKTILLTGIALTIIIVLTMGLFNFFKKSAAPKHTDQSSSHQPYKNTDQSSSYQPYKDSSINFIYNLLFCDSLDLYKTHTQQPYTYPFDILFSDKSSLADLQKTIDDTDGDPRTRMLAYNRQLASGHKPGKNELLAVIVEVGLDEGLDVLASFNNGTARYINHTGKMVVWETTTDAKANELTKGLFSKSQQIVNQIGTGKNSRRPYPTKGNARITFLASDGLSFGEAPTNVLFSDPLAGPALTSAAQLMQYLTEKSLEKNPNR